MLIWWYCLYNFCYISYKALNKFKCLCQIYFLVNKYCISVRTFSLHIFYMHYVFIPKFFMSRNCIFFSFLNSNINVLPIFCCNKKNLKQYVHVGRSIWKRVQKLISQKKNVRSIVRAGRSKANALWRNSTNDVFYTFCEKHCRV